MGKRGNGEGSIYYSENLKRWVGQYTYNGKRKSIYGKTRTELKDKLNKTLVEIGDNKYVDKSNYTLIDIITKNIEEQYLSNKISDNTYKRKKETKSIILKKTNLGNIRIQNISPADINSNLINLTNYSNSVITKVSQMIRNAFDKALLLNLISSNPYNIKGLINVPKSNKIDKKVDALTIEEQKNFILELSKNNNEYNDIFYLLIFTGARIGEILALDKKNIDLKNKIIYIDNTLTKDKNDKTIIGKTTKTYNGTRQIPITNLIYNILEKRVNNCDNLLFLSQNKLIATTTINTHFKKICKSANIQKNVNTHMLRHTYATRCIESGMSAVVLSKLLGHADIETTLNTYTSVFNKFKDDEVQKYLDYISQLH